MKRILCISIMFILSCDSSVVDSDGQECSGCTYIHGIIQDYNNGDRLEGVSVY